MLTISRLASFAAGDLSIIICLIIGPIFLFLAICNMIRACGGRKDEEASVDRASEKPAVVYSEPNTLNASASSSKPASTFSAFN